MVRFLLITFASYGLTMIKALKAAFVHTLATAVLASIFLAEIARASVPGTKFDQPSRLYGPEIYFDVYRNGEKAGYHRVSFDDAGAGLLVDATFVLEIDVLFFTAYRYHYRSRSEWRDGELSRLRVSVDDDGEISHLEAERNGDAVRVFNGSDRYEAPAPILPTDHWNPAVLSDTRVLNTLTGLINEVRIEKRGRTQVATETGPVLATHYAYTGDLDTEVWYDDRGRWVKMRFKGTDGSTIDYRCRRCQGGEMPKVIQ